MKKRNGFTLVELLAVIVILAIILVVAIPKIMNVIEDAKEGSLISSAKLIASEAERAYTERLTLGESTDNITCSSVAKINDADYDSCEIEFINNIAHVKLIGSGKFDGMNVCDATKSTGEVTKNCAILATTYITNLYNNEITRTANGLEKDDTDDLNIRYSGPDELMHQTGDTTNYVKNYVYFNCSATDSSDRVYGTTNYDYETSCEKWRIIGIFDVASTIGGTTEKRLKIIRDSIGLYSWDTSPSGTNGGYGYSIWETESGQIKGGGDRTTKADVNVLLNDLYLNNATGVVCYDGRNGDATASPQIAVATCPSLRINDNAKSMIDDAVWNLGGIKFSNPNTSPYGLPTLDAYNEERGTNIYWSTIAKTGWAGKVGLPYPSDYGYGSTNNECRNNLRAGLTYDGTNYNYTNAKCKLDNWLQGGHYWTLSPYIGINTVFRVDGGGVVNNSYAYGALDVRPVLYLKSGVKIVDGVGSNSSPYILTA